MTDQTPATPLINSDMMSSHTGQTVRVVGKLQKVSGRDFVLQTSDSGHVEVRMSQDTNLSGSGYVEVIGRVSADGEYITEFTCIDLGNNLDLDMVQKLVEIQQKVPEIFG
ncbi:replication factor A protein 3 [Acaromyces ingoldii]|uniref:Replication factor A protein 3 n=1 Tax=Acaromyces ingoldii TaxID=215250 RepID=A0A316YVE3_9BASI|nr:replication factor A protein 3 [Acaromyces ingoldii]PWN91695.1 replication factor A protein 3 [Acaromyces ingoldii]